MEGQTYTTDLAGGTGGAEESRLSNWRRDLFTGAPLLWEIKTGIIICQLCSSSALVCSWQGRETLCDYGRESWGERLVPRRGGGREDTPLRRGEGGAKELEAPPCPLPLRAGDDECVRALEVNCSSVALLDSPLLALHPSHTQPHGCAMGSGVSPPQPIPPLPARTPPRLSTPPPTPASASDRSARNCDFTLRRGAGRGRSRGGGASEPVSGAGP